MKILIAGTLILFGLSRAFAADQEEKRFPTPEAYLKSEAKRIVTEGDRIWREADRIRREAKRLMREASELREAASALDAQWEVAAKTSPSKYVHYEGRNRSQIIMRRDAEREDADAGMLHKEGLRLNDEAKRLWKLSADVDARAQRDWLQRMRICCGTASIAFLRAQIRKLARVYGLSYVPN